MFFDDFDDIIWQEITILKGGTLKRLLIFIFALLMLTGCLGESGHTVLTGKVVRISYSNSVHNFVRYKLDDSTIVFEDGIYRDGASIVDVLVSDDAKSVKLDEIVKVECYYSASNMIPVNACVLLGHD